MFTLKLLSGSAVSKSFSGEAAGLKTLRMEPDQSSHLVAKSTRQLWEGATGSTAPNWHLSLGKNLALCIKYRQLHNVAQLTIIFFSDLCFHTLT